MCVYRLISQNYKDISIIYIDKYILLDVTPAILPHTFSNLSNLRQFGLSSFIKIHYSRFKEDFSFHFSQSNVWSLKAEEEFPSCFQNMTRLTNLSLERVRGEDPDPIPFPTQFCNMIYLQYFTSSYNNISGLLSNLLFNIYIVLFSRPNPNWFDKIGWVEKLKFYRRTFIGRLFKWRYWSFSLLSFLKGEFPLVEGSFNQLTIVFFLDDINGSSKISS